jgi:TonB family protein
MNAYLNFLIEANIGLCLFLVLHFFLLKNESDFRFRRIVMLSGVLVSLVFPLLHLNAETQLPQLGDVIPPTWLPEVVVTADGNVGERASASGGFSVWQILTYVYLGGIGLLLTLFIVRVTHLLQIIRTSVKTISGNFSIIETDKFPVSFSFFRVIVIGQADKLTADEKQQIIEHECEHARRFHSMDIVLIQALRMIFWFNPLLKAYEKIFVQLHEFEADARAVRDHDRNDYCSLVARVALLSADIKLANQFSNSLTLKRIEMIRTNKSRIKYWKQGAFLIAFAGFFFLVACQDQVMNEVTEIAKNSTMALEYPEEVQNKLNELKKDYPDHKYIVIIPDEKDGDKAEVLQKKMEGIDPTYVSSVHVMKNVADKNGNKQSYVIVDYNEQAKQIADNAQTDEQVFMVVEESATMPGGMEALGAFIAENLRYPDVARQQGLEGGVFVQFIVNTDGSLTDFKVLKGVSAELDAEAVRVASLMPKWTPGKQSGKIVRQRFVLPIRFRLNNTQNSK